MTVAENESLKITELENRVCQDIARARSSYSVYSLFIKPLFQKSSSHFKHRDAPLINAIVKAAIDSSISALGRLLQPNPGASECTLLQYKNHVLKQLSEGGPKRSESEFSKEWVAKLTDRNHLNLLKKTQKEYIDNLMPLRNKLVAHSDIDANWVSFQNIMNTISECVDFVEDLHRACLSALEDAGIPDQYLSVSFEHVTDEWVRCLIAREKILKNEKTNL